MSVTNEQIQGANNPAPWFDSLLGFFGDSYQTYADVETAKLKQPANPDYQLLNNANTSALQFASSNTMLLVGVGLAVFLVARK